MTTKATRSKFASFLDAARSSDAPEAIPSAPLKPTPAARGQKRRAVRSPAPASASSPEPASASTVASSVGAPPPAERRGPGRPRGKRSDPEFLQTTAHIRRATHTAVKIELLREGQGREFSELVEELLGQWLRGRE